MPEENQPSRSAPTVIATLLLVAAPIFLLFLPLLLAMGESVTLGSRHVEDFCRTVGIHDFLGSVYRPVVNLF